MRCCSATRAAVDHQSPMFRPYSRAPSPTDVVLCQNAGVRRIDGDTSLLPNHFGLFLAIFRHFS